MDRRTYLAGSATVATAVLGGCTEFADDGREGVVLTHVELGNASDDPQVFDLLVVRDGEIVHWSPHEVEAGGGDVVDVDAPDQPGDVDVRVRVGEEWRSTDFDTDAYDGERVVAVVTYGMVEDDLLRVSRLVSDRPTPTGDG